MKTESEKLIFSYLVKFIRNGKVVTSYLISAANLPGAYSIAEIEKPAGCDQIFITRLKHEILNHYAY